MKNLIAIIFMLTFGMSSLFAFQPIDKCDISMYVIPDNDPPVGSDQPGIGNRIPPHRITCYIDFDAATVEFSPQPSEDPIVYEIWSEDMSFCYYSTDTESEFVEELKSYNSATTIVIGFTTFHLTGTLY